MYACIHKCMCVYVCVCKYRRGSVESGQDMHACIHKCMCVCVCVSIDEGQLNQAKICMHVYISVCVSRDS